MFRPASNLRNAPITAPVFTAPVTGATATTYVSDFKANDPTTIATVGAIIKVLADTANLADAPATDNLRNNCRNMFRANCYGAVLALFNAAPANPPGENDENVAAIDANVGNCPGWITDLVNASKKKKLTDGNVEGYFAMLGHDNTKASAVASLINSLSVFLPDSVQDQAFRESLAPGVWTTYRNNRVSVGNTLHALIPDFRALRITANGDATETAIEACRARPWDVALSATIDEKYKAYGCLFLQVAGTPIDNWIQGNKAVANMPAAKVRAVREIFRKYLDLKNNVTNLDTMTTVAAMTANDQIGSFW
jgi:hypothetical protein